MSNLDKNKLSILHTVLEITIPLVGLFFIFNVPLLVANISLFNQQFLSIFWALITTLLFITYPASKKMPKNNPQWYDLVLALLTMIVGLYVTIFYPKILLGMGLVKPIEIVFGIIAVILVLESVRRTAGLPIVYIVLVFILYAKYGYLIPGILATGRISWPRLFQQLYVGADFMLGTPLKVICQIVFAFILFGSTYLRTGAGDFIMDLSSALLGHIRGGPAKVAIIASSLFGTISGSAVANVSAVGTLTIPLMRKVGYPAHYAGAIEATGSVGGQLMPPVMGAAAFVMAEFLGIPYYQVVIIAIVPAVLYYLSLFIQVDLQAIKLNLKGLPREELPSLKETIVKGWVYFIPIFVLVYTLFILFLSPGVCAIYSAFTAIIISLLKKNTRSFLTWGNVLNILQNTNKAMFSSVTVCAGAGFIVGIVSYTGLGLSFSQLLTKLAGNSLFLLCIFTGIASIILGMGMPTTAAYIMLAVLAAPAMVSMGVTPIVAHLFVFYFGTLSMITPPVCLSVYAAASIADADYMKIAVQAIKLAIVGYIIPFIFVYNNGVLLIGSYFTIFSDIFYTILCILLISFALEGYLIKKLSIVKKLLLGISGICIVIPLPLVRILGLLLAGVSAGHELLVNRKSVLSNKNILK